MFALAKETIPDTSVALNLLELLFGREKVDRLIPWMISLLFYVLRLAKLIWTGFVHLLAVVGIELLSYANHL